MLEMLKQVAESNRAQTDLFATLLKAWTTAPAPSTDPYVSPDDREILAALTDAAQNGDEDAKLILADPKLKHDYFSTFR